MKNTKNRGIHAIIGVLLAAAVLLSLLTGCDFLPLPGGESAEVETEAEVVESPLDFEPGDDVPDVNGLGMSDICLIGEDVYFFSRNLGYLVSQPAEGGDIELVGEFNSCWNLSVYDTELFFCCFEYIDDEKYVSLYSYDVEKDELKNLASYLRREKEGNVDTEIQSYCVKDGIVYYVKEVCTVVDSRASYTREIRRIDLAAGEDTSLICLDDVCNLNWSSALSIRKNKLYFSGSDVDEDKSHVYEYDLETGEIETIQSWIGNKSDSFATARGYAYVGTSEFKVITFGLDGSDRIVHDGTDGVSEMFVYNNYVIFGTSEVYKTTDTGRWVSNYGIYVLDLETGEVVTLFDNFCKIAGVADGWVYFYDESERESGDDWTMVMLEMTNTLTRIRLDGSETDSFEQYA